MRLLQYIGLPETARSILYEKFISEDSGKVFWKPKYERRLRGYTHTVFYERVPLYEYLEWNPAGYSEDEEYLPNVVFYEEYDGEIWSSGPMVYLRLVRAQDKFVIVKWPRTEYKSIDEDAKSLEV